MRARTEGRTRPTRGSSVRRSAVVFGFVRADDLASGITTANRTVTTTPTSQSPRQLRLVAPGPATAPQSREPRPSPADCVTHESAPTRGALGCVTHPPEIGDFRAFVRSAHEDLACAPGSRAPTATARPEQRFGNATSPETGLVTGDRNRLDGLDDVSTRASPEPVLSLEPSKTEKRPRAQKGACGPSSSSRPSSLDSPGNEGLIPPLPPPPPPMPVSAWTCVISGISLTIRLLIA